MKRTALVVLYISIWLPASPAATAEAPRQRHAVPKEHPRLLGPRAHLQRLARDRPDAYQRVVHVARQAEADVHSKMISMALVTAIDQDRRLGRQAIDMARKFIDGPIKRGHVRFGHDLALCAIVYDLCYEYWSPEERSRFHEYVNKTVDANVRSESHVFHNGWYGYKNWGIGLACYAAYYENSRAGGVKRTSAPRKMNGSRCSAKSLCLAKSNTCRISR